jgi:uncharacterized membrane protein YhiD involved in acid resistance
MDQKELNQIGFTAHWYLGQLFNQVQRFVLGLTMAIAALWLSADVGSQHGVASAVLCLFAAWCSYGTSYAARWAARACPFLCAAAYIFYIVEVY